VKTVPLLHQPTTLVDDEDYEHVVAAGPWHFAICDGKFYARRHVKGPDGKTTTEGMHTFLTGWALVDHKNGDGLDNTRANLRPATPGQNVANQRISRRNTSGFKGVNLHKFSGLWRASIGFRGKSRHLGYFHSPEDAARAYDAAAADLFGEFARPNFPQELT
jgi:hypothetical protein